MLIGHAYVERENRDAWTKAVLGTLDATVGARLASGELGLQQLPALADPDPIASQAVRQPLVRRPARGAGPATLPATSTEFVRHSAGQQWQTPVLGKEGS